MSDKHIIGKVVTYKDDAGVVVDCSMAVSSTVDLFWLLVEPVTGSGRLETWPASECMISTMTAEQEANRIAQT